jgi:hypothetical protein
MNFPKSFPYDLYNKNCVELSDSKKKGKNKYGPKSQQLTK